MRIGGQVLAALERARKSLILNLMCLKRSRSTGRENPMKVQGRVKVEKKMEAV